MSVVTLETWYLKHVMDNIAQGRIPLADSQPDTPDIPATLGLLNAARARQPLGPLIFAENPVKSTAQQIGEYRVVDGRARCEALARVFVATTFTLEIEWPVYLLPYDRLFAGTFAWGTQDEAGAMPLASMRRTEHFMKWEASLRDREPDQGRIARILDEAHTASLQVLNAPVPVYIVKDWKQEELTQMRHAANNRFARNLS